MLTIITCRGDGFNPNEWGELESTGGTSLFEGGDSTPILVHGFDSPEAHVLDLFGTLAQLIGTNCELFSWPGCSDFLEFRVAVGRAPIAGIILRLLLTERLIRGLAAPTIITHSLGARVALTALRKGGIVVKKLILLGAAVDTDCLEPNREFGTVPQWCQLINVVFSQNDPVLKVAYPVGSAFKQALGFSGLASTANLPTCIKQVDVSNVVHEHSGYLVGAGADVVKGLLA